MAENPTLMAKEPTKSISPVWTIAALSRRNLRYNQLRMTTRRQECQAERGDYWMRAIYTYRARKAKAFVQTPAWSVCAFTPRASNAVTTMRTVVQPR